MFDTVTLKVMPVYISPDKLHTYNPKIKYSLQPTTGQLHTKYQMKDEKLPYIVYWDNSRTLLLQVSIPKFLYGENVSMVTEADVSRFFDQLQNRVEYLFGLHIPHDAWKVERCDVCWNFQVGRQVGDYIRLLGKQKIPYKDTSVHNQDQTVEFWNKSNRTILYDKQKQLKRTKAPKDATYQAATGILRLEVKSSKRDMKEFSSSRKAVELLHPLFFTYITQKALEKLEYPTSSEGMDYAWLLENKNQLSRIETLLGFEMLRNQFGEATLKQLYPSSTLATRKTMVRELSIPKGNGLVPLVIG